MSTYGRPPYAVKLDNGGVAGTDVETIQIIAKKMNFNLVAEIGEGWWGEETLPNGTVRQFGSMLDVLNGKVHFAGAEITLLPDVWPYFDYMWHMNTDPRLITGKPKVLPPYFNLFRPFSQESWIAICVSMISMGLVFSILTHFYGYQDTFISFVSFAKGNYI